MRTRTRSRAYTLQMLYQLDIRHDKPEQIRDEFWQAHEQPDEEMQAFANRLFDGTVRHLAELDALITGHAEHWEMKRMAVIDRNILRLGAFELLHLEEVPPKVCINEAVELAKRFGDEDSGKFINGILDAIHKKSHARTHG